MSTDRAELPEILGRIGAIDPYLACGIGRDDPSRPWWTSAALASDDGSLERLAGGYGEAWGVAGDRVSQASLVVLDLSWYAFAPLAAALLVTGAVPRMDGASVALDPAARVGRLALASAPVHAPASVDDLRHEIEGWMEPIVEAIASRRWLGRKPAWWGIGDRVVGAFEYLGEQIGEADRARDLASRLVHHAGSPLDSPRHRFETFEHRGVARTIGLRAACCRFHRIPGEVKCTTCPLLAPDERQHRVATEIEATLVTVEATS